MTTKTLTLISHCFDVVPSSPSHLLLLLQPLLDMCVENILWLPRIIWVFFFSFYFYWDELLSLLLFVSMAGRVTGGELCFCMKGDLFMRFAMKLPFVVPVVEFGNEITGIWVDTMWLAAPCVRCMMDASLNWSLLFTLLLIDMSLLFRSDLALPLFSLIIWVHSALFILLALTVKITRKKTNQD